MVSNQFKTDFGHDNPSVDLNGEKSNGHGTKHELMQDGHVTKHELMQEQQQQDQLMHDQQICKEGNSESQVILILSGDDLFEDLPSQGIKKDFNFFNHNLVTFSDSE